MNYKDIDATWLRWATLNGELLPTPQEVAEQERQEKELAKSQLQQVVLNLLLKGISVE